MADQKISQLSAAAALTGTELVPIVQSSSTVSTTPAAIKTYALNSPAITTRMAVGGPVSTQALINANTVASVTGNVVQYGLNMTPTIASDVTTSYYGVRSAAPTAAASFTLPLWCGFQAGMTSVGAGSTITSAYGFIADSSVGSSAQVTNAYGLYSNLASGIGTARWNIYSIGSAPNYLNGALGIGTTGVTGYNLRVDRNLTGATGVVAIRNATTIQSDATSSATMYDSVPFTVGATYTLPVLAHYRVQGATANAPSIISNQYGFRVLSNLTAATNNYAFQSDLAAAANVWNIYFADTAQNYIRGNVGIGSGKTVPSCALDVNGQVAQSAATSITAAGTNLATATPLTATFSVVSTTPSGTGVILPNVIGTAFWVHNAGANALLVYPPSGTVNGTASHSLATTAKMQYIQITAGVWYTMS